MPIKEQGYKGIRTLIEARLTQYRRQHEEEVEKALGYKSQYEELVSLVEQMAEEGAPQSEIDRFTKLAQEKAELNQKHYVAAKDLENRIIINEELLKAEIDREGGDRDGGE